MAEYLIEHFEQEYIHHLIKSEYGFTDEQERDFIYSCCHQELFLHDKHKGRDEWKVAKRKNNVYKKLIEVARDGDPFNLEGILRFRLTEYTEDLCQTIEYAINELVVEQDYREFIHILRQFLTAQNPKIAFIHLYHVEDKQFIFYNEEGVPLTEETINGILENWVDPSVHHDDIMMSTLISIAPKRLIVHTHQPQHNIVQTLKHIFQHRMSICTKCQDCLEWKNTEENRGNKSGLVKR
nr:putative sporulation protein YtxC [Caldalkalibacillus salinus]